MLCANKVPDRIEQAMHSGMDNNEHLSLPH